jgi:hypothetical protein
MLNCFAITEYDSHNRFMLMKQNGDPKKAISVLNRLDKEHQK